MSIDIETMVNIMDISDRKLNNVKELQVPNNSLSEYVDSEIIYR